MGFGLLFVGYVLLFFPVMYLDAACILVGSVLMCCALFKLRGYEKPFRICAYLSIPGIAVSAIKAAHRLWGYLSSYFPQWSITKFLDRLFTPAVSVAVEVGFAVFMLIFICFMLWGMFAIGKEVGLMNIQVKSLRNLVITGVYYLLAILMATGRNVFGPYTDAFRTPVFLLGIVWMLLIAINIYTCYRWITLPELQQAEEETRTIVGKMWERAAEKAAIRSEEDEQKNAEKRQEKMKKHNARLQKKQNKDI